MSVTPDLPDPETTQPIAEQTALACYLGTVVAIGNCLAEVCPPVGAMYRDRLLKLPRRLGFDATPQALKQSREAVETDLAEYAATASTWINAGAKHAEQLLNHLRTTEETLAATSDLQRAFLDDMAEHIDASAEVDDEAQLRASFRRYAAGLRAYSRKARSEKLATVDDLRRRREEIEAWLAEATVSDFTDPETGLLNRAAAERRIHTEIRKKRPFCAIVVSWTGKGAVHGKWKQAGCARIVKDLADRLGATIRPYDIIFHWSPDQLLTIFEAPDAAIATRALQIGGWLGASTYTVELAGETMEVKTLANVSVVEYKEGERATDLIARIESLSQPVVA